MFSWNIHRKVITRSLPRVIFTFNIYNLKRKKRLKIQKCPSNWLLTYISCLFRKENYVTNDSIFAKSIQSFCKVENNYKGKLNQLSRLMRKLETDAKVWNWHKNIGILLVDLNETWLTLLPYESIKFLKYMYLHILYWIEIFLCSKLSFLIFHSLYCYTMTAFKVKFDLIQYCMYPKVNNR